MKRYDEYLTETLADEIKSEDKQTTASREARKMGLTYLGFGRYADSKGKVAYVVDNGKLVPFKGLADVQNMYTKAKTMPNPEKAKEANDTAEAYNSVYKNRQKEDKKIFRVKEKEVLKTDQKLNDYYSQVISDEDMQVVGSYVNGMADTINRYLYKGFDDGTDSDTAQQITDTIAALDDVLNRTAAPFDFSVYTSLSGRYSPDKMTPDSQYLFRGYISASLDHNVILDALNNGDDAGKVLYQIEVGHGQKALHIDSDDMETILPRGSIVRVVSGPHQLDQDTFGDMQLFHCIIVDEEE